MAEVFPSSWTLPEALPYVKELIKFLPLDASEKKTVLLEWAEAADVKVTIEMVEEITGLPAGEI